MTILEEITAHKRQDLIAVKENLPAQELYRNIEKIMDNDVHLSLPETLLSSPTGIIAEYKRKSPSLGWIKEKSSPEEIIPTYIENGASALSILTDEPYFGGKIEYISRMRPNVNIPILRKDFIIDEYQIFETKIMGADAILLIAACLKKDECQQFAQIAQNLHLDVLLEIHEEAELDYICEGVNIIGVNNRNLHIFNTDIQTSFNLANRIPKEFLKISESGLKTAENIKLLRAVGFKGFLMGEKFMKSNNPGQALGQFIKELKL